MAGDGQSSSGDGMEGRSEVAARPVVPEKPGNAGGGKGALVQDERSKERGIGDWET